MSWPLSPDIDLLSQTQRISAEDASRQQATAAEILRRLADQPGVVLADEVGMGKTFVALAVAASVIQATGRERPVVVMVPPAVAEKWPTDWAVFSSLYLPPSHGIRASAPIRRGSDFLKLLDDPPERRNHLIFLTHGALTRTLSDPVIRLAILRRALLRRPDLEPRKRVLARACADLLADRRFDEDTTTLLLDSPPNRWREVWERARPHNLLDDDPVPEALTPALRAVDLDPLREALLDIPINRTATYEDRMRAARARLTTALGETWTQALGALDVHLPLLVLDEAHHVKNLNQLARLFTNTDAEALRGPLGNMFERMLFLTATPFQLGHGELLRVLERFQGVRWEEPSARARFEAALEALRVALDRSQASARRLELAWDRIDSSDAAFVGGLASFEPAEDQPEPVRTALQLAQEARVELAATQDLLRPWVIRHVKPHRATRRKYRPGRAVLDGSGHDVGLAVDGRSTLPFLLAARAQAVAALEGPDGHSAVRSYFAYGLASSYEAYVDTRANRVAALDADAGDAGSPTVVSPRLAWYLERITRALPADTAQEWAAHPKIAATVRRVTELWKGGQKCLVFCFYVETGKALRGHISRALQAEVVKKAAAALGRDPADEAAVLAELGRIGDRLLRADSRGYELFRRRVLDLASDLPSEEREQVADIVIRFMRTPSFLVRFVDLSPDVSAEHLVAALDRYDASGLTLEANVRQFADSFRVRVQEERSQMLDALSRLQTGGIASDATDFDPAELSKLGRHREIRLPNVRLANGDADRETRRRLMLAFNTPFFPEVLIASSVMAEGVDLHRHCRHVIHHDLDWNPSVLEQRTGRVDRIGSKAAVVGQPVVIYEPYVAGTHDEKMFRVMKDRERWFGVVMGDTSSVNEFRTERRAARVALPPALAAELTMNLAL